MSAFTTPPRPSSSSRVSSRKTTPLPLVVPAPSVPLPQLIFSPRRRSRGGRHVSRNDPGHCGLFPLTEADEDNDLVDNSRCPSWYSNAPSSPGPSESVDRSSIVYTPFCDDEDPFEDSNFSPMSDTFHHHSEYEMSVPKTPSPLRSAEYRTALFENDTQRTLRSPIRTPITPAARSPRDSAAVAAPYPVSPKRSSVLLPALPILALCEHRAAPPSPPTPSTPLTPTTPAITLQDGMSVNLVTALRDLLTTCGEFDGYRDNEMFADADEDDSSAYPVAGQFDDAVSPKPSPRGAPSTIQSFYPSPPNIVGPSPRTPPPKPNPSLYEDLLRAPRQTCGPREPLDCSLQGDHTVLAAMSADALADRRAAEAAAFEDCTLRSMPSLPSLSSGSSLSSASSASFTSLASFNTAMSMTPVAGSAVPNTPPQAASSRKAGVSSRRILRSPLPPLWTA